MTKDKTVNVPVEAKEWLQSCHNCANRQGDHKTQRIVESIQAALQAPVDGWRDRPTYDELKNCLILCANEYRNLERMFAKHSFTRFEKEAADTASYIEKIIDRTQPPQKESD